jgi:ADP-heptose:LPS heptosyltransferase
MARTLVIKPSSLGDIIHSAEAVDRLARSTPDSSVTWVANAEYADFVREFPGVSEVLPFPRRRFRLRRFPLWVPELLGWVRDLRRSYDVAVDLQGLQRSALVARLSGAAERFGPADARELAGVHYTHIVRVPPDLVHAVDRVHRVVEEACRRSRFLRELPPRSEGELLRSSFRLPVPPRARARAEEIAAADGRDLLVLAPGARWPSKLWPAQRWADFLALARERRPDLRPLFLGAPGEEHLVEEIRAAGAVELESLVGAEPIWITAALMERAAAVVTMDSAPLHLAVAVGAPTVSFFGPTDPRRVGPRGEGHRVLRRELECLACYQRECPLERRICVPETTAEEAFEALESVVRVASRRSAGG